MRAVPSPSRMLAEATGLEPIGAPASEACTCRLCGGPVAAGEPRFEQKFGATFNDGPATLDRVGNWICGWCGPFIEAAQMTQMQGVLVHQPEGEPGEAWRVTRKAHIRWAFEQNFEGPLVIALATRKREHLIWQAPVSLSPDVLQLRVGRDTLLVRRPVLDRYREAATEERLESLFPKTAADKRLYRLGQQLEQASMGGFDGPRAWYADLPEDLVRAYEALGPGELWFAQYVLTQAPDEPPRFKFDRLNPPKD
ncbi:type IV CRISPR-associated protein Csf1 [Thioalkalivibrio sp. ALE16]|uniref:type IV CRISPR-associated protein Csf1 n=1 Tax=Thioalkalivibrio sp. ALE16 TaxID=1158172 RepID=UPI001E53B3F7|nr:type IV CRISPR-associated protein Csf1 [Thioalkalivibrio sp. ALE16]